MEENLNGIGENKLFWTIIKYSISINQIQSRFLENRTKIAKTLYSVCD